MADKKLNSVEQVKDMAFVYAETEAGDVVKLAKDDLLNIVSKHSNFVKYFSAEGTNIGSLSIDISGLTDGNFKAPFKWELFGAVWQSTNSPYAYGLCRYDTMSGGTTVKIVHNEGFNSTPSGSINSDGILTVYFGMQLSTAKLYVYY